jgi:Asp-tRNA(Asn)/Glu-tRNA(Gln) amidotransferase A subunit family amidase
MSPSLDMVGPIARTAEDAAIMLEAMAGPDRHDPAALMESVPRYCDALDGLVGGMRLVSTAVPFS